VGLETHFKNKFGATESICARWRVQEVDLAMKSTEEGKNLCFFCKFLLADLLSTISEGSKF
jgi:hypothetical protein